MGTGSSQFQQCQRFEIARDPGSRSATITVERFDAALGWYTAGAMTLPLCQIPLLQQALERISAEAVCSECPADACGQKIIPFPLLASATAPADRVANVN